MQEEDYIKNRLDQQIEWYDEKSIDHQRVYKHLKRLQIVLSALIPFLIGYVSDLHLLVYIIGVFGVVITCIEGILSMGKYHENWIEYRTMCETLRHEKYMYLTNAGVYKKDDENEEMFSFFVERVESIISQENLNWASLNNQNKKENN